MAVPVAIPVNHLNYPDKQGRVYCREQHEVMKIDTLFSGGYCGRCGMCYGSLQGAGVECFYTDLQDEDDPALALAIPDPQNQLVRISNFIDEGTIPEALHCEENIRQC